MSSAALYASGIFAHENGQRLLHILLKLADRGFLALYEKCKNDVKCDYYQKGLKKVYNWPDSILQEDIEIVRIECPDVEETFEGCFASYVLDRYHQKRAFHRCPAFIQFVRHFMQSLGQHDTLIMGDYFARRDQMTMRIACMDAARQALYSLVSNESVRIELQSDVGSVAGSKVSRAHRSTSPMAHPPEDEIRPDDSISQIGSRVSTQQHHPARSREQEDDEEEVLVSRPEEPEMGTNPRDFRSSSPTKFPSVVSQTPPAAAPYSQPEERPVHHDASSVVSRHDLPDEQTSHPKRLEHTSPVRSRVASAPSYVSDGGRQRQLMNHQQTVSGSVRASSRDSSVSISMKKVKSPRA